MHQGWHDRNPKPFRFTYVWIMYLDKKCFSVPPYHIWRPNHKTVTNIFKANLLQMLCSDNGFGCQSAQCNSVDHESDITGRTSYTSVAKVQEEDKSLLSLPAGSTHPACYKYFTQHSPYCDPRFAQFITSVFTSYYCTLSVITTCHSGRNNLFSLVDVITLFFLAVPILNWQTLLHVDHESRPLKGDYCRAITNN